MGSISGVDMGLEETWVLVIGLSDLTVKGFEGYRRSLGLRWFVTVEVVVWLGDRNGAVAADAAAKADIVSGGL